MMHKNRVHRVVDVADAPVLAEKLAQHSWTECTGFRHAGYLYLNDATPGGTAEYAIINESNGRQVESITFGWCNTARALEYIRKISAGEYDAAGWATPFNLNHADGSCHHCA